VRPARPLPLPERREGKGRRLLVVLAVEEARDVGRLQRREELAHPGNGRHISFRLLGVRQQGLAEVRRGGLIDAEVADAALDLLGVDAEGLDRLDREILTTICGSFGGGPVGLSTLAVAVGEEADTIEDVYEPYLLQRGFLQRTPRGRCATVHAYRHLGLEPPGDAGALF